MLKDLVTVATRTGDGAYEPLYADPVTVRCNVDNTRRLVRNANGDEAVSESTIMAHPEDAGLFTVESMVTIDGRASTVLAVNPQKFRSSVVLVKVACS
ncbi:MAG: hypothetical protein ABFE13_12120 [Phycisphaerales bacterium]